MCSYRNQEYLDLPGYRKTCSQVHTTRGVLTSRDSGRLCQNHAAIHSIVTVQYTGIHFSMSRFKFFVHPNIRSFLLSVEINCILYCLLLQWVTNILEKKSESERIVFENADKETGKTPYDCLQRVHAVSCVIDLIVLTF